MTDKHTPGPWTAERNPMTPATWNIMANGIRIAEVLAGPALVENGGVDRDDAVQGPYNAAVIAASTALLSACVGLVEIIQGDMGIEPLSISDNPMERTLAEAIAAIASARGEG